MQEQIYSGMWGETLHKVGVGKRVYIYDEHNRLYNPALILHNDLQIDNLIKFLQRAKKEKLGAENGRDILGQNQKGKGK